jgi:hypothetical protein
VTPAMIAIYILEPGNVLKMIRSSSGREEMYL